MAEKNGSDVTYIPPVVEVTDDIMVSYVGATRGAKTKYGIAWLVPSTDDEAKELYNCTLDDLIRFGIRNLTTKPNYQSVGFDENGNLVDGGHEAMQKAADEYRVGVRVSGEGVKAKAARLEQEVAQKETTISEMEAEIARLKALAGEA